MCNTLTLNGLDRKEYTKVMAENLSMLRIKLGLNQDELALLIGVTRQTISAIESKSRDLTWTTYLALLFLFTQNDKTKDLVSILGVYPQELSRFINLCYKE